jgi:hypothetical protein
MELVVPIYAVKEQGITPNSLHILRYYFLGIKHSCVLVCVCMHINMHACVCV